MPKSVASKVPEKPKKSSTKKAVKPISRAKKPAATQHSSQQKGRASKNAPTNNIPSSSTKTDSSPETMLTLKQVLTEELQDSTVSTSSSLSPTSGKNLKSLSKPVVQEASTTSNVASASTSVAEYEEKNVKKGLGNDFALF